MNRFWILPALALVACSGTDGTGLLGDSGGNPQDDASSLDASSTTDAIAPDDASTLDASTPDVTSILEASVPDAHIGPPDSKIQCGSQLSCSAQSEMCCWHMNSTNKPYECVTSVGSCSGIYDVPITCSNPDNCASQGNPGSVCCATGGQLGLGQCSSYDVATVVACKSTCDFTDYEIGCSIQQQNCSDDLQTCVTSKCTDPGATMCY